MSRLALSRKYLGEITFGMDQRHLDDFLIGFLGQQQLGRDGQGNSLFDPELSCLGSSGQTLLEDGAGDRITVRL
jgi:hypothetical protein